MRQQQVNRKRKVNFKSFQINLKGFAFVIRRFWVGSEIEVHHMMLSTVSTEILSTQSSFLYHQKDFTSIYVNGNFDYLKFG